MSFNPTTPRAVARRRLGPALLASVTLIATVLALLLPAMPAEAQQAPPSAQGEIIILPESAAKDRQPGDTQQVRVIPDAQFDALQKRREAAGMEPLPDPRKEGGAATAATSVDGGSSGPVAAIFFWLIALSLVGGAIFVITRSNLIVAVMGMVGTFFAIAVIYAMLYAHFLAAIQVLVYAGAIMVLFVFVIMILNKPEAEPWSTTGLAGKVIVVGVLLYLLVRLVQVLWFEVPAKALAAPAAIADGTIDWGSTKAVGYSLFYEYLFPFEAVSVVLLIAVVGAVAVARPHERPPASIPDGVPGGSKLGSKS